MTGIVKVDNDTLELTYNLHDLPTAQHKAGLAGLLLLVNSLRARGKAPLPEIVECRADGVTLVVSQASLQTIFDDWFRAVPVEIASKSKWSGTEPKRIVETPAAEGSRKRTERVFVYEQILPALSFLSDYYEDEEGLWVKLWRDMLWGSLRGIPTTRSIYEETWPGGVSSAAPKEFARLLKAAGALAAGDVCTESFGSSLFLGAQDVNAERVPFVGEPADNLLLCFWPLASLVFAPRTVSVKGEFEDVGFVFAVPEVSDVATFLGDFGHSLRALSSRRVGYRPEAAIIDLPEEAGLEYLHLLSTGRISSEHASVMPSIAGIEVHHVRKRGNSICLLQRHVLEPRSGLMAEYEEFRRKCLNPFYKSLRIRNLLARDAPWYEGADAIFAAWPSEFFVWRPGRSPTRIPFFGLDVRVKFAAIEESLNQIGGAAMTDKNRNDCLARCVHRLVQQYLWRRTEEKSGVKYESFRDKKTTDAEGRSRTAYPPKYLEALEKVAADAFLAMRGRKAQDFVEYFSGTICSVPQFLPEADYLMVSDALLTDPDTVKTLAMLAVSANSKA